MRAWGRLYSAWKIKQGHRLTSKIKYLIALPFIVLAVLVLSCGRDQQKNSFVWNFYSFQGDLQASGVFRGTKQNEELPWIAAIPKATGVVRITRDSYLIESREYRDGLLDGDFIIWQSPSRMLSKSAHKNGLPHGVTLIWHEDGPLRSVAIYELGELHGSYKEWHRNGIKRAQAEYRDGRKHGVSQSWDAQGRIVEDAVWREGHPWNGIIVDYHRVGMSPVMAVYLEGERKGAGGQRESADENRQRVENERVLQ